MIPRQHCRLTICIELVELTNSVSVSDDKIQITILILRRGALSNRQDNEENKVVFLRYGFSITARKMPSKQTPELPSIPTGEA